MIQLNPPRRFGLHFAFRLAHCFKARRPILRRAVYGADAEHFDFAETFEPTNCAVSAAQPGLRNGLQTVLVDSDLPVRLQASQKVPAERATEFQVFNRAVPTIKTNQLRVKSALESLKQHFGEVVVLGFPVAVFIKNAIIYRHAPFAVRPEQGNQVDSVDDLFLLSRPMPINEGIKFRKRLLKGRVVKNQNAALEINLRFRFQPKRFGIGFKAGATASE